MDSAVLYDQGGHWATHMTSEVLGMTAIAPSPEQCAHSVLMPHARY